MKTPQSTVASWGKSVAVRIPAAIIKSTGWEVGQAVQFEEGTHGVITMRPVRTPRPHLNLDDLLAKVTDKNLPSEADFSWGKPVGSEAW